MELFFSKVVFSFVIVVLLVWLAERRSVQLSGIFSSLPNVSLVTMLFLGLEQGAQFSSQASAAAIWGYSANILAVLVSVFVARSSLPKFFRIFIPLFAYLFFLALAGGFPANLFLSLGSCVLVWAFSLFILRDVKAVSIQNVIRSRIFHFLFKFAIVSAAVFITTAIAPMIGERWSGLLTTFPSVTLSVAIIIGWKYGWRPLESFFRSAIFAWLPTAVYFAFTTHLFPLTGVVGGTLVAAVLTVLVSFFLNSLLRGYFLAAPAR